MGATSSRLPPRKQKLRGHRSQSKTPVHQPIMPLYRTSKFTELFDSPGIPAYPHSKFTEHFDIDFPFINPTAPETEKARADLQMSKPEIMSEPVSPKQALSPIRELSSRPSTPVTPTPRSQSLDIMPCLSPSSVYSRASSASKPFFPIDSPEPPQSGAYFVFNGPDGEFCDTRHLFENTAVPARILIAALSVLIEEPDVRDVNIVEEFRARLPRFSAWVKEKEEGDRGERLGFGDGVAVRELGDEFAWLRSQWVYEGHQRAVVAIAAARANVVKAGDMIKRVGSPRDGTKLSEIGNENEQGTFLKCSEDDLELPEIISKADDDGDKSELSRGRCRMPRRATSAKRNFKGLESW